MNSDLKSSTINGLLWSCLERMSGQLVGFVVIVIMSRLLTQDDYGIVGMLMIFIDIAQTLVDSGITQALIRKTDRGQVDCSTAFFLNICLSLILYLILFVCAPYIADFYEQPQLVILTRIISLSIIINALMMVQKSLFSIKIDFKTQTKASLSSSIISGVAGIIMAYSGFGLWSIVIYQLLNLAITAIILWLLSDWRPIMAFSWNSFKYFFSFGSKLTVAGLMHTVYKDIYLAAIGKVYNAASLGLYTRAHQFGALPSYNLSNIVQRVSYPVLCRFQDDSDKLRATFVKFLRCTVFCVFPLMIGLSVLSEPLVVVLLGESWRTSGTYLSVLCLSMMWMPVDSLNLNLLQVRGRTDYYLRCEIWKKIFGIGILFSTLPMGLMAMCWGQFLRAIIDLIIDTHYTGRFLRLGLISQMKEILPTCIYTFIMAICVLLCVRMVDSDFFKLILGLVVGVVVFIFLSMMTNSIEYKEFSQLINKLRKKK